MADETTDGESEHPDRPDYVSGLNANHVRVLSSSLAYLEQSLAAVEGSLQERPSELGRYVDDLTPAQRPIVIDYLEQLRERIVVASRRLGLKPPARIPISRWLQTMLTAAQIALEELAPARLRGYGEVAATDAEHVASVVSDLDRSIRRLATLLSRPNDSDLRARIASLDAPSRRRELLADLERIATRHGLVELRPAITALVELFEVGTFEVAVFGRVSCGKSSLLNWIVGQPVLPVGATPVTAVPTRIEWGEALLGTIRFADGRQQRMLVPELAAYVTEAGNPANHRGVIRATIEVPAVILQDHLVLVDTPGVGSLATHGAREAYNYLPRCDLGVLMIDASSTVGRDDLDLLRRLVDSGIDAQIVLSKADQIPEPDRPRVLAYFTEEIARALGRALPVDLVSTTLDSGLAKQWFAARIAPLGHRAKEAQQDSAARKLAALHGSLLAILRATVERGRGQSATSTDEIERLALAAEAQLRALGAHAEVLVDRFEGSGDRAIHTAARRIHDAAASEARAVLESTLTDAANEYRRPLELDLVSTRARLHELLAELARVTPIVTDSELHIDLAAQPALTIPTALRALDLDIPHWPAAERRLASRIQTLVGAEIQAAFETLQRALRVWSRGAVEQLAAQVATRIEPARAQGRSAGGTATEVAADLEMLERG